MYVWLSQSLYTRLTTSDCVRDDVVLVERSLENGLIKPKHVVIWIFNCGGDGFMIVTLTSLNSV
jgi:hypothetical protein